MSSNFQGINIKYEDIVGMALTAFTLEECFAASAAITHWLTEHPNDLGLHEIAGSLGIVKAAALEREGNADNKRQRDYLPAAAFR